MSELYPWTRLPRCQFCGAKMDPVEAYEHESRCFDRWQLDRMIDATNRAMRTYRERKAKA